MAKVGSQDVAQLAGVSRSTVSRVFTPGTYVAEDTRVKVMRAAEMLGYRPNIIARSLTMRRTRLVGIVTGHLENPSHAAIVRRIAAGVQDHGMATLLVTARYNEAERVLQSLLSYQVDALVVTSAVPTSAISRECARVGIPLVVTHRTPEEIHGLSVYGDNVIGTDMVTDHLVSQGYRKFAYISGLREIFSSNEREQAYALALARHGLRLLYSETGNFEYDDALVAMRSLLSREDPPDAVFCANDIMAAAALDVARYDFVLRPGEDIAVVGYDESPLARLRGYDLTSVNVNSARVADGAVDYILESQAAGAPIPRLLPIAPELVVRGSSTRTTDIR